LLSDPDRIASRIVPVRSRRGGANRSAGQRVLSATQP
jgi:hypothetical protein